MSINEPRIERFLPPLREEAPAHPKMTDVTPPPDPADIAQERRQRVENLIRDAEAAESSDLARASNYRLRAICEHLGLRLPDTEEDE